MAFQGDSIFWVEVEKIVPNPFQPRREFDESKLKELAESVRMYGILQPMTVTRREVPNDDGSFRTEYELIAGERRLRASKIAGIAQVPVIIRDGEQNEQEKLELAIIENLQREDLNAVDRALAFRQLADVFSLSHAQVAKKVGRSREYVSNSIRILALPDYMLDAVRSGDISEGHARTLLMLNDRPEEQDTVFRETMLKKLSVREVERIARGIATEKVRKKESIDSDLLDLEKQFTETLGTRVSIVKTEFGGRLTIDYFSPDELQVMLTKMREEQGGELKEGSAAAAVAALAASTPLQATSEQKDAAPEPVAIAEEPTAPTAASEVRDEATSDTGAANAAPETEQVTPADAGTPSEEVNHSASITEAPVATPIEESAPVAPLQRPIAPQAPTIVPDQVAPDSAVETPTEVAEVETPANESTDTTHPSSESQTKDDEAVAPRVISPSIPTASESATVSTTPTETQGQTSDQAPHQESATPENPPAQPLSLRDQLALMLQKKQSAQSGASASATPATPSQPASMSTPSPSSTPTPTPPAPETKKDDDDSDLYSMNNFTV